MTDFSKEVLTANEDGKEYLGPFELGKVHHADCIEALKLLPDKSVDCVITDPPYAQQTHAGARRSISEPLIDFESISEPLMIKLSKEFIRICKTWVIFTCEWHFMNALEATENLIRFGIWNKPTYTPQFTGDRPATGWEAVAIMHGKGKKKWNGGGVVPCGL